MEKTTSSERKKAYTAPVLSKFGDLVKITQDNVYPGAGDALNPATVSDPNL